MVEFIGMAVILCCVIGGISWFYNKWATANAAEGKPAPFSKLTESELVKKFNGLGEALKSANGRGIDQIASDMLNVLKEYKCRKIEQFVESEQLLNKNKNHLTEEIAKVDKQIARLKADALALKKDNMTDEDFEIGALYMAQIDETEKLKQDLIKTAKDNEDQIAKVDKQVKSFNAKYTIKEGSITNMIIKAKTQKNFSNVDLKLNDLISEFNDKVQDIEIEQKVRAEISGTPQEDEVESANFIANKDAYVAKYKELLGNK